MLKCSATMPPPYILIVDDDRLARASLRDCLHGLDGEIGEAEDGEEALEKIAQRAPDVVLLDLLMPRKSGLHVLAELRARRVPSRVLVISSFDTESLIEQALKAGADGFIAKPFHPIEIAGAVKRALEQSGQPG